MRALVTGSSGFIGRHMVAELVERGYAVWSYDIKMLGYPPRDCREFFLHEFGSHFDLVVHCAALVDGRESIENQPARIAAYNLSLDAAMFEWALRAKPGRVLYFSSSAVYPTWRQQSDHQFKLRERDIGDGAPDQTYGHVKQQGEWLARCARQAGVPVTVVRPFSGYGSDQDDCYPFPAMIRRAFQLESPFEVWGDGTQVRDFIHVDDVVAGALAMCDHEVSGPINLGTGIAISMDQLALACMNQSGYVAPIKHLGDKPSGVSYRVADTTEMIKHYLPTVTLAEGIARAMLELVP